MNFLLLLVILFSSHLSAETLFISPFVQRIQFEVKDGMSYFSAPELPEKIVQEQIKYMFGALNEVDSGIDFPQLKIDITSIEGSEIHYRVRGEIAWSKKRPIPRSFTFSLPKFGDTAGLTSFLNKYQKNCSRKPSNIASFWNYYRPNKSGCVIDEADVVKLNAEFNSIPTFSESFSPDYSDIFKDNKLEMTVIMTKDRPLDVNDVSFYDLSQLCGNLVEQVCHREMFQHGVRVLLHAYLVNNFDDGPQEFLTKIESILSTSDVISYNGHSGMGINIESWMKYYPVKDKSKYQIFFFNSCDTYGYFRNEFLHGGNRQVILNATPNYFGTFANSNLSLISKFTKSADYNEILLTLPQEQHPLLLLKRMDSLWD